MLLVEEMLQRRCSLGVAGWADSGEGCGWSDSLADPLVATAVVWSPALVLSGPASSTGLAAHMFVSRSSTTASGCLEKI